MSGTSMAAPHVTGSLALLKAKFPGEGYRQLIDGLLRGVDQGPRFASKAQTGGRLNLLGALNTNSNRPFNDDFASRPRFNSDNLALRSNNAGATSESGEPVQRTSPAPTPRCGGNGLRPPPTRSASTPAGALTTRFSRSTRGHRWATDSVAANDNDLGKNDQPCDIHRRGRRDLPDRRGRQRMGASGLTLLNSGTTPVNARLPRR
jgi:hypothetical protein